MYVYVCCNCVCQLLNKRICYVMLLCSEQAHQFVGYHGIGHNDILATPVVAYRYTYGDSDVRFHIYAS